MEVSLKGLREALIYGYNNKSLRVNLILCPFSKIIVLGPSGPLLHLAIDSWPNNGTKNGSHLVEKDLNPCRKWLFIPMMFLLLLHEWGCLVRSVIIVAQGS